ncbi:MAG: hypothetical protein VYA80_06365 [Pseudomonadota bacterium]|nr:hypothetical protein [Pseudomonadota bacterium]
MTINKSALESVMGERGRLRTAHEMLKAAIELDNRDNFSDFYVAVGNYMEAGMGRLDEQDIKMLARLAERIGSPNKDEQAIIDEVYRRLDGNRVHLIKYLACRDALITDSGNSAHLNEYESVSHAYIDYIHNDMGHHAPSTDMARKLFLDEDWIDIADIDEDYFVIEKELYFKLLDARPEAVPLGMSAEEYVEEYRRDRD